MKNLLQNLNISEKAVAIYLELLQNGASSVLKLSKATGINRTSIYPYINELKGLGLIEWDENEVGNAIKTTDPKNVKKLAQKQLTEAQTINTQISNVFPQLKAMHNINDASYSIQKFTGSKECQKALEQIYQVDEICGYCGEFIYKELDGDWYRDHLKKIYKVHNIKDRVVFTKSALKNTSYKKLLKTSWFDPKFAKYRIHETLELPESLDVYILEDRVITIMNETKKPTAVITKSQKYRDYERSLFEIIWKSSLPLKNYKK